MAVKSLTNKDYRKFGEETFGELKFICYSTWFPMLLNDNQWMHIITHGMMLTHDQHSEKPKYYNTGDCMC